MYQRKKKKTSYIKQYHYYLFSIANPFRFEKGYFYVKEIFLSNKNNQIIRMLSIHIFLVSFLIRNTENCFSFTMLDGQTNMITLATGSFIIKNTVYENINWTSRGQFFVIRLIISFMSKKQPLQNAVLLRRGQISKDSLLGLLMVEVIEMGLHI